MVAAVAKAKKAPMKRTLVTERSIPAKRPHQGAEPAEEAPRPSKRVKKLAKKGDREIHVVPSDTTGTPAPAGSPSVPAAQAPPTSNPPAVSQADPIVAPASAHTSEPVVAPEMGKSAAPAETPPTPTVVLEV